MVLITDGGPGWCLHAYLSAAPGEMENFVAASETCLQTHPPSGGAVGDWAEIQIAFVPAANGSVVAVGYTLWDGGAAVKGGHGYTMTLFDLKLLDAR